MWLMQREYAKIGEALTAARERVGLTQAQVAARLKKPQSFVSNYERGQRRVDILEFLAIASAVGTDPVRLFSKIVRDEPPPKARARN